MPITPEHIVSSRKLIFFDSHEAASSDTFNFCSDGVK